jgi:predicted PurR-regulated permease PerM
VNEGSQGRLSGAEQASFLIVVTVLLFVFHFGLAVTLVTGLLAHLLLQSAYRLFHTDRLSHLRSRMLAAVALGLVAAALITGLVFLTIGFVRGRVGELPALVEKAGEVVEEVRTRVEAWGVTLPLSPEGLRETGAGWLHGHALELTAAGGRAGKFLIHSLVGAALGFLVFFQHPQVPADRPLARALGERVRRLGAAFDAVVSAQVEISAVNTFLTAFYLGALLLIGRGLPLFGTLVAVTFATGLLPVVGNLISNSLIVLVSLSVSPGVALASLGFLIVIHKLEYLLNARIVGGRVGAAAWEILLAMLVMESAFGLAGVALAPILYAYLKRELADRGLV